MAVHPVDILIRARDQASGEFAKVNRSAKEFVSTIIGRGTVFAMAAYFLTSMMNQITEVHKAYRQSSRSAEEFTWLLAGSIPVIGKVVISFREMINEIGGMNAALEEAAFNEKLLEWENKTRYSIRIAGMNEEQKKIVAVNEKYREQEVQVIKIAEEWRKQDKEKFAAVNWDVTMGRISLREEQRRVRDIEHNTKVRIAAEQELILQEKKASLEKIKSENIEKIRSENLEKEEKKREKITDALKKQREEMTKYAESIFEATRTSAESVEIEITKLNKALWEGYITVDTYHRKIRMMMEGKPGPSPFLPTLAGRKAGRLTMWPTMGAPENYNRRIAENTNNLYIAVGRIRESLDGIGRRISYEIAKSGWGALINSFIKGR